MTTTTKNDNESETGAESVWNCRWWWFGGTIGGTSGGAGGSEERDNQSQGGGNYDSHFLKTLDEVVVWIQDHDLAQRDFAFGLFGGYVAGMSPYCPFPPALEAGFAKLSKQKQHKLLTQVKRGREKAAIEQDPGSLIQNVSFHDDSENADDLSALTGVATLRPMVHRDDSQPDLVERVARQMTLSKVPSDSNSEAVMDSWASISLGSSPKASSKKKVNSPTTIMEGLKEDESDDKEERNDDESGGEEKQPSLTNDGGNDEGKNGDEKEEEEGEKDGNADSS